MNLVESFRIAMRALNANKVRSALTMLGVIIGVAAVILLVSIGTGVQSQITGQIAGLGSNLLYIFPGDMESGGGPLPVTAGKVQRKPLALRFILVSFILISDGISPRSTQLMSLLHITR